MQILRHHTFRTMPWKNGGGETTEIIVSPAGARMDAFDWRVSMARVAVDGPFSLFPGIDRSLTVLEGEGIVLNVEGLAETVLTPQSQPFAFPGDRPTQSRLLGGPLLDLNVMTRRGAFTSVVQPYTGRSSVDLEGGRDTWLVLCRKGAVVGEGVALDEGDALFLPPEASALRLDLTADAQAYVICIRRHR